MKTQLVLFWLTLSLFGKNAHAIEQCQVASIDMKTTFIVRWADPMHSALTTYRYDVMTFSGRLLFSARRDVGETYRVSDAGITKTVGTIDAGNATASIVNSTVYAGSNIVLDINDGQVSSQATQVVLANASEDCDEVAVLLGGLAIAMMLY